MRPAGMGEAFTGVADDVNAILFNPAGLAQLRQIEINGMYSDLFSGLHTRLYNGQFDHVGYNYLSVAVPIAPSLGTVAAGWAQLHSVFYKENTFILSFGRSIWAPYTMALGIEVSAGVNLKGLHWQVEPNEYTTNPDYFPFGEKYKAAFTADAGVLAAVGETLRVGASVDNIIPADVGLAVHEQVPVVVRAGGSYRWPWRCWSMDSLLTAVEVTARNRIYIPKAGVESWWFNERLGVRAGIHTEGVTAGLSIRERIPESPLGIQLDYAFAYPFYVADTLGSHRVGFLLRWDPAPVLPPPSQSPLQLPDVYLIPKMQLATALVQAINDASQTAQDLADRAEQVATETRTLASPEAASRAAAETAKLTEAAQQVRTLAEQAAALASRMAKLRQLAEAEAVLNELQMIEQTASRRTTELGRTLDEVYTARYFVPEKDRNTIVVGIQTEIFSDFGPREQIDPKLMILRTYLEAETGMKIEFREYNIDNLKNDFIHGYIDVLAAYSAVLQPYVEYQSLKPIATIQTKGQTSQPCCLFAANDQPFARPEDLKDKRLGYFHSEILPHIKEYFYPASGLYNNLHYFRNTFKFKNGPDALGALQMKGVDAIVGFAYMLKIADNLNAEYPIGIKCIAKSKLIPNQPLYYRPSRNPVKQQQMNLLADALLRFHENPAAESFLNYFGIDRFVPVQ
ncbi:MAG: PhnD/SsuA/transferrin family substrate-binding protein [candidate division FCPU426 bacterium]